MKIHSRMYPRLRMRLKDSIGSYAFFVLTYPNRVQQGGWYLLSKWGSFNVDHGFYRRTKREVFERRNVRHLAQDRQ
jgi:hypothetical protein